MTVWDAICKFLDLIKNPSFFAGVLLILILVLAAIVGAAVYPVSILSATSEHNTDRIVTAIAELRGFLVHSVAYKN